MRITGRLTVEVTSHRIDNSCYGELWVNGVDCFIESEPSEKEIGPFGHWGRIVAPELSVGDTVKLATKNSSVQGTVISIEDNNLITLNAEGEGTFSSLTQGVYWDWKWRQIYEVSGTFGTFRSRDPKVWVENYELRSEALDAYDKTKWDWRARFKKPGSVNLYGTDGLNTLGRKLLPHLKLPYDDREDLDRDAKLEQENVDWLCDQIRIQLGNKPEEALARAERAERYKRLSGKVLQPGEDVRFKSTPKIKWELIPA